MFNQRVLATPVTGVLCMQLWNRYVTFIDDEQIVLREIVKQRKWGFAWLAIINMHGVVLDAIAISHFLHHLEVITGSHPQPLRLQQLALRFKHCQLLLQFLFNSQNSSTHSSVTRHVVGRRKDDNLARL